MPKILERLVQQLMDKGKPRSQAFAIATSALQKSGNLKPGTQEPTAKGTKRGNMTAEARAKSRHGGDPSKLSYSKKTNRVRQKKG